MRMKMYKPIVKPFFDLLAAFITQLISSPIYNGYILLDITKNCGFFSPKKINV